MLSKNVTVTIAEANGVTPYTKKDVTLTVENIDKFQSGSENNSSLVKYPRAMQIHAPAVDIEFALISESNSEAYQEVTLYDSNPDGYGWVRVAANTTLNLSRFPKAKYIVVKKVSAVVAADIRIDFYHYVD